MGEVPQRDEEGLSLPLWGRCRNAAERAMNQSLPLLLAFNFQLRPQGGYPRLPDAERRIRSMSRLSSRSFNASRLSPAFLPRQMPRLTFTRPFELK